MHLTADSANIKRCPNVGLLLGHRLRRWPYTKPTLGQRFIFAVHPLLVIGIRFVHSGLTLEALSATIVVLFCIIGRQSL